MSGNNFDAMKAQFESQFNEKLLIIESLTQQLASKEETHSQLIDKLHDIERQHLAEKNASLPTALNGQSPHPNTFVQDLGDPKVPDVTTFDGNPKKCFEFLAQLNIFFLLQPHRFGHNPLLCSYYLGIRCTGPAAIWFSNVVALPNSHAELSDFKSFSQQFQNIFSDPTRKEDAERRLLSLKQGKRSVAQMLPEFQTLVFITGWNEDNLFRIFLETLNDEVRDELLKENRPLKFSDYVTRAINIDRQLTERRTDRTNRRSLHSLPSSLPTPQNRPNFQQPQVDYSSPMDLSVAQTQRRGPLTPEERNHRLTNGLCIICGSAAHLRSSCPLKRVDFPSRQ
jgi:hypothetical protein